MQLNYDLLREVPFLSLEDLGDRTVMLLPLWDGASWHHWVPCGDTMIKLATVGVVEGAYLGRTAHSSGDLLLAFVNLAWQHASWPELIRSFECLVGDILHLATAIAKLEHFEAAHETIGPGTSEFVRTEIEYILVLTRSIFDVVQETVSLIWKHRTRFHCLEMEARRKQNHLPDTFSKMVLLDKAKPRSVDQILERYAVNPDVAAAYASAGVFFFNLRRIRDEIVHGRTEVDYVHVDKHGLAQGVDARIPKLFGVREVRENHSINLISLWPTIVHIAGSTLVSCESIFAAIARTMELPPPLVPGYKVYLRGHHSEALSRLMTRFDAEVQMT